jgi:hypothetical protein
MRHGGCVVVGDGAAGLGQVRERIAVRPGGKRGRGHWLLAHRAPADPAEIARYT